MFRASSVPISCTRGNWFVSCRLCGRWAVQLITPDDGHSRCPKHVEFRDKIKFWILDASCCLFIRRPWILLGVFRSLRCIPGVITFQDFSLAAYLNDCLSLYWQMFYYLFFKINGGGWDRSWYRLNTRLLPTTKWHRLHYKDNQSSDDGSRVNCRNVV
jgi:hypothetical protein